MGAGENGAAGAASLESQVLGRSRAAELVGVLFIGLHTILLWARASGAVGHFRLRETQHEPGPEPGPGVPVFILPAVAPHPGRWHGLKGSAAVLTPRSLANRGQNDTA